MGIIKQCIVCGKEFKRIFSRQVTCCKEHSFVYKREYDREFFKQKGYNSNPKRKKYMKKYLKSYGVIYKHTPKYKAYVKEYSKLPHVKDRNKKWKQSPTGKLSQKKYNLSDSFKKSRAKWAATPKGKLTRRMLVIRRRARLGKIILKFTKEEWKQKLEATKGLCPGYKREKHYVGIWNLTLDHIYSVMRAYKDFLQTGIKRIYTIDDVQPLCQQCNSSKHDKPMEVKN